MKQDCNCYAIMFNQNFLKWNPGVMRGSGCHVPALSLAMSRDGSSGGVVRLGDITEKGVERFTVLGDQLPHFYEG